MTRSKKIIVALAVSIALSSLLTYHMFNWLSNFSIDSNVEMTISKWAIVKLFTVWLIYFCSLIIVPFLIDVIIPRFGLKKTDLLKALLALELFALIFSFVISPPDFFSIIFMFLICQPIVIVNGIVLRRKLNKLTESEFSKNRTE